MVSQQWADFNQQVIVVTGGSSGIGAQITRDLCASNAQVIVVDINLPEPTSRINAADYRICDITERASVQRFVSDIRQQYQRIDGLVNNAAVNRARLLVDHYNHDPEHELSDDDFDFMVKVNQKGPFICTQEMARLMIQQKSGVVVNILSEAGIEGSKGQSCYAATKAALHGFTLSWAKELGTFGIRVVGVAPGINEPTPMGNPRHLQALAYTRGIQSDQIDQDYSYKIPLGRPGKLEEISNLVNWLLSDNASYITGTTINITGGKSRG